MEFLPSGDVPRTLRLGWRTWLRVAWHGAFFALCLILLVVPDVPVWIKVVAALFALGGAASTADLMLFSRRWTIHPDGYELPSLFHRSRRLMTATGADPVLLLGRVRAIRIEAEASKPTLVGVNAMVSGRDVRVWFDSFGETIRPVDEVKQRRRDLARRRRRR